MHPRERTLQPFVFVFAAQGSVLIGGEDPNLCANCIVDLLLTDLKLFNHKLVDTLAVQVTAMQLERLSKLRNLSMALTVLVGA